MKKIIAAIDGLKYSAATTSWATRLSRMHDCHVVGTFLDDEMYTSYNVYELLVKKNIPEKKLEHYKQKDKAQRDRSVKLFSKACSEAQVNYSIHRNHDPALRELVHESVFSDLLVIDKNETFTHYTEQPPSLFIRELLAESHCPVLLVDREFTEPDKIVLLYDGHPSSVYVLKMLSYLLSKFQDLPLEVASFKNMSGNMHLPDNTLMKEFVKRHFHKTTFRIFKGNYEENIAAYLSQLQGHPLVAMGAYSRGMFSRWLRPSLADVLMQANSLPLFIAHAK